MTRTVAWTLIHFCWQGAALATVLAIALHALRHRAAEVRYLASCFTLALMLASAVGTFVYLRQPVNVTAAAAAVPFTAAAVAGTPAETSNPWLPWITIVWSTGVAVLSCRWLAAWMLLRSRTRTAPLIELPELEPLQARLAIARRVVVRSADWLTSPAVAGWIRPVLLMPASALSGLDRMQLEAILAHELAHIRRHDYFWNLLQTAAETLLFYHPAVWWVSRRIRAERENCCDDVALSICGDRAIYARALLRVNELALPELSLAAARGPMQSRIGRILHGESGAPTLWPLGIAAVVIGAILFAAAPHVKAQNSVPSPYKKWLKEDVAYIIKPEERARFLQLKTNEEREHFIEQFWAVRGEAVKEEHYRRIAYSNDRYKTATTEGWRTDRGHIYIVYGPPDEIETHGARDDWRYHNIPGVGQADFHFENGELLAKKERHDIGAHVQNVLLRLHNRVYRAVFHSLHGE